MPEIMKTIDDRETQKQTKKQKNKQTKTEKNKGRTKAIVKE